MTIDQSQPLEDYYLLQRGLGPSHYPKATIEGLDISDAQFPSPSFLPENVSFGVLDLLADQIPEKYVGRYDVVHIRYIIGGFSDTKNKEEKKRNAINNLKAMLKPGGFIQWQELVESYFEMLDRNLNQTYVATIDPKIREFWAAASWLKDLPEILKDYGFVEIEGITPAVNRRMASYEGETFLLGYIEIYDVLDQKLGKESAQPFAGVIKVISDGVKSGEICNCSILITIAKKPF
ncbi:hypothetical protein B7463_g7931, partial [Scytalidium lignicola]